MYIETGFNSPIFIPTPIINKQQQPLIQNQQIYMQPQQQIFSPQPLYIPQQQSYYQNNPNDGITIINIDNNDHKKQ